MNFRDLLNIFEQGATPPATPPAYKGSQDAQAIARASGVKNVNVIKPGQVLKMPNGAPDYKVQKGDTLDKIARRNPAAVPAAGPAAVAPTMSDRAADPNVAGVAKAAPTVEPAVPTAIVRPNTTLFGGRADAPKSPFAGPQEIIKPSTAIGAPNSVEPTNAPVNASPIGARTADFVKQSAAKPAGGGPIVTTVPSPATTPAAPPMSNVDAAVKAASAAPAGGGPISTTNPSQPPPSMDLSPKDQSTLGNLPAGPGQVSTGTGGTLMSRGGPVRDGSNDKFTQGGFRLPEEAELEEEDDSLSELMRLSGNPMQEKAPPGAKAERQVKHVKAGYAKDGKLTDKEKSIAYATAWKQHNKSKVSESVMLEAGSALEHIINKFKHETKNFVAGQDLDNDLYEALYDYYSDNGEMPYGVAKARTGDPFTWVTDKFADELQLQGYNRQSDMLAGNHELSRLAELAGLSESQVSECGDMGSMEQHDSMSVSTNMSSDGTKSVNISAQGDKADSLLQMLKMAGMRPYDDHEHMGMTEPEVIMISSEPRQDDMHDEMMHDEEMMDEEYANEPEQEYHSIDSILRQGNDLNREKQQFAQSPKLGDNPMAESMLDADLEAMLESILVREEMTDVLKAEQPYKDEKTGKMVTPPKGATMPPADSQFAPGDKRNVQTPKPSIKIKEQTPPVAVKPAPVGAAVRPVTTVGTAPAVKKPYTKANDPDFGNDW